MSFRVNVHYLRWPLKAKLAFAFANYIEHTNLRYERWWNSILKVPWCGLRNINKEFGDCMPSVNHNKPSLESNAHLVMYKMF